jgi:hypothetical protein
VLEERAPRYMGVSVQDKVTLTLENVDAAVTEHQVQIHPQKPELGMRVMRRSNKVRACVSRLRAKCSIYGVHVADRTYRLCRRF